jgi:hypothetical protein
VKALLPSGRAGILGLALFIFVLMIGAAMVVPAASGSTHSGSPLQPYGFTGQPPSAPTGLDTTVASTSEIDLSWTNPSGTLTDNTVYVWVSNSCSGGASSSYSFGGVYTTYAEMGLTPSTTYSFEVTANNSAGESLPSNCATATTDSLGVPTELATTVVSATEIDLSWLNPSGSLTDNHIYVWVADSCTGSPTSSYDFGGVYETYAETGLNPSTSYGFEVTASTSGVEGPMSACATATTDDIAAPTGLTASAVSAATIVLAWTNPVGNPTDNQIYGFTGASCTGSLVGIWDYGSAVTGVNWNGLAASTTYSFHVTASTSGGQGAPSNCASDTTLSSPVGAPTGLTATAVSDATIVLAWTNPSGSLTDNTIYGFTGASCSGSLVGIWDYGSAVSGADWNGLASDTTYSFEVTATVSGGEGPASNCASDTTFTPPIGAPTGLTATATSDATISLAWTNPSGSPTDNQIYAFTGGSCSGSLVGIWDYGSAVTGADWNGLASDTTYSFEVTASVTSGQGPMSNCASDTTFTPPVGAPTGLSATATTNMTIELTWTNPSGSLVDNQIYGFSGSTCAGAPIGIWDYGSVVTDVDWNGLAVNSTYSFEVSASTSGGQGPVSGCATATTPP